MKLEVVVVPVADGDRAKKFSQALGWREDADYAAGADFRVVQLAPPGSACSIIFGTGVMSAAPGSARGLHLVVTDIEAARAELIDRGADVGRYSVTLAGCSTTPGPWNGCRARFLITKATACLPRSVTRTDHCLPGRRGWRFLTGGVPQMRATVDSAADLAEALRCAAAAHGRHEAQIGRPDPDWPDWYAQYLVQEQAGHSGQARPGAGA